jgi:molybdopterin molybdotransferase
MNTVDFDGQGEGVQRNCGLGATEKGSPSNLRQNLFTAAIHRRKFSFGNYHRDMSAPSSPSIVLSFEDARRVVEEHAAETRAACFKDAHTQNTETLDLLSAAGRVLAESVAADRDIPPFPRATRDGYAVRSADLAKLPATLDVVAEIKAGAQPGEIPCQVKSGQAAAIMTGAPVPAGADAIVMVEYTSRQDKSAAIARVEIRRSVAPGENIVARGAEAKSGSQLLTASCQLNHAAIALAASVGKSRLKIFVRPRVAVLTTGDEIVDLDAEPGPAQIRNSNSYSLAVQIQQAGGEPVLLPIAPDEPKRLRELIEEGLRSELLLMTGGVSMGRYDLVEQVLAEMKAEFFFTGAKIQPGRPVVFGRGGTSQDDHLSAASGSQSAAEGRKNAAHGVSRGSEAQKKQAPEGRKTSPLSHTYFFGLPGNPVSTMVTFELFARPMLEALAGMLPRRLIFLHAQLNSEIRSKTGLKRFLPAILSGEFENAKVELVRWQGSGDIAATASANCYIVIPPDRDNIPVGDWVAVLMR